MMASWLIVTPIRASAVTPRLSPLVTSAGVTVASVVKVTAPLAAIGLVAGTALVIGRLAEARESATSRRAALSRLIEVLVSRAGMLGIGIILSAGSLLLTHDRAGILAAVAGILALCLAACAAPSLSILRRRSLLLATLGILLAAFVAGAWGLAKSDGNAKALAEAAAVSAATAEAVADAPFTGTGYGTFAEALRPYRDAAMPERLDAAKNAFLAAALELGAPAALLVIVAGLALLGLFVIGLRRRQRNAVFACAGAGGLALLAVAGGAGALAGGGAVPLAAAILLGTAAAQSFRTGK
jgi:hypothetical protein